jgi:2-phospho-L-lactate guanylyltransferase (CobY/MobA/RfbA family)
MNLLLVPIAPLSKAKSRLGDCFSREQIEELTIAMFKDLGSKLLKVNCFDEKLIYCNSSEILELANNYNLIGIKEEIRNPPQSFDKIIDELNDIAIKKYNAQTTTLAFLDLILISVENFYESNLLLEKCQILMCPAIQSGGISIFGRNPSDVISASCFADLNKTSLKSLFDDAKEKNLNISVYDSLRAGFDLDVKQDLVLAYQYLKIFNLKDSETFKFLKKNLKLTLKIPNKNNNRDLIITEK